VARAASVVAAAAIIGVALVRAEGAAPARAATRTPRSSRRG
jgi:hypothetical protein